MLRAAREAIEKRSRRPTLIAVTVLTSLSPEDLQEVGLMGDPRQAAGRLAGLAQACGLDGAVCSPQEAPALREQLGERFVLVTPGVRPATAAKDDQQRVATPRQALAGGAHYLVIGRPITRAPDPLAALHAILDDIAK